MTYLRPVPRFAMLLATGLCTAAFAKLPPLDDAAKAKAAEAAARTAWNDKIATFQLCKAQDAVASSYRAKMTQAGGAAAPASSETPPCGDPGPFAAPTAPTAPLEAAGAHSPPGTAKGPPNSKVPESELKGGVKK